jgi:hypothetical protein
MQQQNRSYILSIFIFIIVCSAGSISYAGDAKSGTTTTVILIRHAERDNSFILTARGHKRAKALVETAGDMGIKAIYSPDLERNLDTVRPLAIHLGIDISLIPRISKRVADKIVSEILNRHPGEVVLIVGNGSGNLRSLHHRLGGTGEGPYKYGELFIYTIPDQGEVKVLKSRWGDR